MAEPVTIKIIYDPEQRVYCVYGSEVPGLNVEAASVDEVIEIVRDVLPDLLGDESPRATIDFHVEVPAAA